MPNPTAKPRFSARALGMTRPLVLGLALSALAMPPALMAHDGKPHGKKNDPCPRCGNKITAITAHRRQTNYCRRCQPGFLFDV